jgi:hypothetical protein
MNLPIADAPQNQFEGISRLTTWVEVTSTAQHFHAMLADGFWVKGRIASNLSLE